MAWTEVETAVTGNISSGNAITLIDSLTTLVDASDTTKGVQLNASGVTAGQTRILSAPDADTTLVGTATTQTLTNKTIALGSNTVSGTLAQFNTALSDDNFASLTGAEILTNKTLTTPTIGSFTNATHNHTNAAGGGQITTAALSNYTEWAAFTPTLGADSGTFSGTATTAQWKKIGTEITVACYISAATVSATPTVLTVTIPGSFTAASTMGTPFAYSDNGTEGTGLALVLASGTTIRLAKDISLPAWQAAAGNGEFMFTITFKTTT